MNRVFSPLFNISYRTRGGFNVSISKEEFSNMCVDIYTPKAINKIRSEKEFSKGSSTPEEGQLSIFSMIGDDEDE